MRWPDPTLSAIDEWRHKQPDLPTRPRAIRRLVELALNMPKRKGVAGGPMMGRSASDERTARAKR
jgi:hypothetical protein